MFFVEEKKEGKVMRKQGYKYPDKKAYMFVVKTLKERGVEISALANLSYKMTSEFVPDITMQECKEAILAVLHKRDFLSPAMIMLDLDRLANEKKLSQPLNDIISNDIGVFGVDEELASAISMIYGPIGITNFGYLDRVKRGIIAQIDHDPTRVNTFLDDLVGAIVAASCGKISHDYA